MTGDTINGAASQRPPGKKEAIVKIAGRIRYLPTGQRAQLRRIYLTERHDADGVVIGLLDGAGVHIPADPRAFRPWRLFAHCAALLSGTGKTGAQAHGSGRLGAALHAAGLSENRLLRLMSARGPGLDAQVIRAMRMLAQHGGEAVDLRSLFDLVGNHPERAEAARIRIAQDYYAADARSGEGTSNDD